jgi:hypothetical protein
MDPDEDIFTLVYLAQVEGQMLPGIFRVGVVAQLKLSVFSWNTGAGRTFDGFS